MTSEEIKIIEDDISEYGLIQFRKYDEFLISNLFENKITFGPAHSFNDPFDCNLPIHICTFSEYKEYLSKKYPEKTYENLEYIKIRANELAINPEKTRADIRHLVYNFRRFSCFNIPKNSDHLANSKFWANYANKHNGICMKFSGNLRKTYNEEHKGIVSLMPIKYCKTDEVPKFNYFLNDLKGKPKFATQYFFGTKSKQWEDEYEIRLVYYTGNELEEEYINYEFDPNDLIEVYIGCRINNDQQKVILKCLSDKKYDHVDIYKLEMDDKRFKLNDILIRKGNK